MCMSSMIRLLPMSVRILIPLLIESSGESFAESLSVMAQVMRFLAMVAATEVGPPELEIDESEMVAFEARRAMDRCLVILDNPPVVLPGVNVAGMSVISRLVEATILLGVILCAMAIIPIADPLRCVSLFRVRAYC